jgi:hypothetical protein
MSRSQSVAPLSVGDTERHDHHVALVSSRAWVRALIVWIVRQRSGQEVFDPGSALGLGPASFGHFLPVANGRPAPVDGH